MVPVQQVRVDDSLAGYMLDLAEKVFLNRKVPGWLYQVERGATSIWERWDAMAPDGTIYNPQMKIGALRSSLSPICRAPDCSGTCAISPSTIRSIAARS